MSLLKFKTTRTPLELCMEDEGDENLILHYYEHIW